MHLKEISEKLKNITLKQSVIALILITLVTHSTYIFNEFTWLDHIDIEQQNAIKPITQIHQAFLEPYSATHFYRPMITVIHSIDAMLYQQNAAGYHTTNLILHTLVVTLIFFLITKLFKTTPIVALISSIIFAIHPLHSLSVGAISYRTDLLATLFTLLTFIAYLNYSQHHKIKHLIFSGILLFLGLCSKETTILWFPVLILSAHLATEYKFPKKYTKPILTYGLALAIFIFPRSNALDQSWQFKYPSMTLSEHVGTRLAILPTLLTYLILPTQPPISDATKIYPLTSFQALIGLIILAISIYITTKIYKNKSIRIPLIIGAATILPALNILPLPRFISPHYLYFTAIAISFLVVLLLKQPKHTKHIFVGLSIWIVIATISTLNAGFRFKNDHTLFAPEVAKDPHFKEGQLYLGTYYSQKNEVEKAQKSYQAILQTDPKVLAFADKLAARINLANTYVKQQNYQEAENTLREALETIPPNSRPDIQYNLALVLFTQKKFPATITLIEENQLHKKIRPAAALILAESYIQTNQKQQAQTLLEDVQGEIKEYPYTQIYDTIKKQLQ